MSAPLVDMELVRLEAIREAWLSPAEEVEQLRKRDSVLSAMPRRPASDASKQRSSK